MTFKMVSHAFRMLFSNFGDALKLSLLPFVLIQIAAITTQIAVFGSLDPFSTEQSFGSSQIIVQLTNVVASLILGAWLAVGWHRFVLAEEYPSGFFPPFRSSEVFLYIGKLMTLVGLGVLCLLPIGLGLGLIGSVLGEGAGMLFILGAFGVVLVFYLLWAFTRLSVILPAASVGKNMALREAWATTETLGLSLLGAALIVGLFGAVLQALSLVFMSSIALFVLASGLAGLIATLLTVSLATTIYGVAVEGRQLT